MISPGRWKAISATLIIFGIAGIVISETSIRTCLLSGQSSFCSRYDPMVPVLWTSEHQNVTSDALHWFNRYKRSPDEESFRASMKSVFEGLDAVVRERGPLPAAGSCAVVGNSGNLRGAGYGTEIDAFDTVIRLSHAPTQGFESDVGTRSTFHFTYRSIAWDKGFDPRARVLYFSVGNEDFQRIIRYLQFRRKQNVQNSDARSKFDLLPLENLNIVHPDFIYYVQKRWLGGARGHPSTGMIGIVFGLHLCDSVDVYGFGADRDGNWDHYYDPAHVSRRKSAHHSFDAEAELRTLLQQEGRIRVHPGVR